MVLVVVVVFIMVIVVLVVFVVMVSVTVVFVLVVGVVVVAVFAIVETTVICAKSVSPKHSDSRNASWNIN